MKAPVGQIVTANEKPPVEAGGDSLIDLSDEGAPVSVPSLNTKLAGLGMFIR